MSTYVLIIVLATYPYARGGTNVVAEFNSESACESACEGAGQALVQSVADRGGRTLTWGCYAK